MKALVLAGGTGSRLRPFSYSMPKQLVPVANKPVLFHGLEMLKAAGITECGVIVNDGSAVRQAVGDGSDFGLAITYIVQDQPRGLAHCVLIARDFLADDDFLMFLGDNVFADGLADQAARFRSERSAAQLVLMKVDDPSAFGVAEVDPTGRVTSLQEKPSNPRSNLAVTGAYFFSAAVHEAARGIQPSWRGELEITDALQWLVDSGADVRGHVYSGYWKDTGNVRDLLECNRALLDNITAGVRGSVDAISQIGASVVVEPGAMVTASRVDGPTVIGRGTTIVNSYVGPYTAVGSACVIENAGVEDSILLDRASVRDVRDVKGSLIGRASGISRGGPDVRAHRLIVGDDSRVEVPA
jgi:glucose-1-phosphate thymidylyltransferase